MFSNSVVGGSSLNSTAYSALGWKLEVSAPSLPWNLKLLYLGHRALHELQHSPHIRAQVLQWSETRYLCNNANCYS